jgi:hypothetical protein
MAGIAVVVFCQRPFDNKIKVEIIIGFLIWDFTRSGSSGPHYSLYLRMHPHAAAERYMGSRV